MAVQHFDHKRVQELHFGQGGNQHRKRRSVGCRAFLGVFQTACRLLYEMEAGCWRGCCMIGQVFKDLEKPKSVTGKLQTPYQT